MNTTVSSVYLASSTVVSTTVLSTLKPTTSNNVIERELVDWDERLKKIVIGMYILLVWIFLVLYIMYKRNQKRNKVYDIHHLPTLRYIVQ